MTPLAALLQQARQATRAPRQQTLRRAHIVGSSLDRAGRCLCGVPVCFHFDATTNVRLDCADAAATEVAWSERGRH